MVLAKIKAQKVAALVARAPVIAPNSAADSAARKVMVLVLHAADSPAISCADQALSFSTNDLKCEVLAPARAANTLAGAVLVLDAVAIDSQCEGMVHRAVNMDAAITLTPIETSIGNWLKVAAHAAMALAIMEIEKVAVTTVIAKEDEAQAQATVVNDLQCAVKAHHAMAIAHDSTATKVRRAMVIVVGPKVMKTVVPAANA
jgi:hypothetical protein